MPKSPTSSKHVRKNTRNQTRNEDRDLCFSDELMSDGEVDKSDEENNAKMLNAIRQNHEQKSKRANTRAAADSDFQSRKRAIYAEARKNARDLVTSGVGILEAAQSKLADFQSQEVGFQKYLEDSHLPILAQKEVFSRLLLLYPPLLQDLGNRRAEKIDEASRMLKNNGPARQDALKEFSKNARQQLEQARLREKEAIDAAELIQCFKNSLRG